MTRIEDQLDAAARRLRAEVDRSVDVEAARRDVVAQAHPATATSTRRLVAVAAAAAIAVGAATYGVLRSDERGTVVAGAPSTSSDVPPDTSTSTTPTTGEQPPSFGPDLAPPAEGREITFDGVASVRLDQVLEPSEVRAFEGGGSCGYWGPAEPSHDGDEPLTGLVADADTATPTVLSIMVRNPTYRTLTGVGLGTTLETLQRVYGTGLVVDRVDQDGLSTGGLRASYQDVAAVRDGDRALTFYLLDDAVGTVKVSHADFWGDDEGCA